MSKEKISNIVSIIFVIIFFLVGFYLGRKEFKGGESTPEVIYIKGDTIRDSIPYPVPVEVSNPIDTADIIRQCVRDGIYKELFPEKTEIQYIEITKEDTSSILVDWAMKRGYSEVIFDSDTIGKCTINATVQYNRISMLGYEFSPIIKEMHIKEKDKKYLSPYIGLGALLDYGTIEDYEIMPKIDAGFFIKEKNGINFTYCRNLKRKSNLFGISYLRKF